MENKIIINGVIKNKFYKNDLGLANKQGIVVLIKSEVDDKNIHNKVVFLRDNQELFSLAKKMKKDENITLLCDYCNNEEGLVVLKVLEKAEPTSFEFFGKVEKFTIKNGSTNGREWVRGEHTVMSNDGNISLTLTIWNNLNKIITENKNKLLKFSGYTKLCYNQFYDNYYTEILIKNVTTVEEVQNA